MKRFLLVLCCILSILLGALGVFAAEGNVYRVVLDDTIDNGSVHMVKKAIEEADASMADLLIVEVDTYGGYIDSAIEIKDAILSSPVKTVTYVNKKAMSAGSLIAVAGEKMYMAPGSTIGAAEAREGEEKADYKVTSAWVSEMRSTAEARGKDPKLMAAMAEESIVIDGLVDEGELLSLKDNESLELGLADGSASSLLDVCTAENLTDDTITTVEESGLEKIAAFLTSPVVSGLLIAIGIVGLLIELLTTGIGAAGIIGISAWVLYFAGHALLDNIGWTAVIFFAAGLVFIILEAFVIPGFGVAGIAGIASILFSVFLIAPSVESGLITIGVALVAAVLLMVISMKNKKTRSLWKKLVLKDRTDAENGYTSPNMDNSSYLGKEGVALTPLRPAGTIDIDGDRVDVVTEGDFLATGTKVKVIGLDGTRIVVRLVK